MRIKVTDGASFRLNLPLPNGLVLNRFTAGFACRAMEENGIHITRSQMVCLIHAVKAYKRNHPEWVLVDVQSSHGESVYIKI